MSRRVGRGRGVGLVRTIMFVRNGKFSIGVDIRDKILNGCQSVRLRVTNRICWVIGSMNNGISTASKLKNKTKNEERRKDLF